jgi:hypothetical protein
MNSKIPSYSKPEALSLFLPLQDCGLATAGSQQWPLLQDLFFSETARDKTK